MANLLASFPRSTPRAEFFAIQRVRSKMQVPPEGLFDRTNLVSTPYKKIGKGIATISGNRM